MWWSVCNAVTLDHLSKDTCRQYLGQPLMFAAAFIIAWPLEPVQRHNIRNWCPKEVKGRGDKSVLLKDTFEKWLINEKSFFNVLLRCLYERKGIKINTNFTFEARKCQVIGSIAFSLITVYSKVHFICCNLADWRWK